MLQVRLGEQLLARAAKAPSSETGTRRWRIPVTYGGEHGIDLEDVAKSLKTTPDQIVARHVAGETAAMLAALGAFLGHLYPVWLGFRGGKGVATFLGVMLALAWPVGIAACLNRAIVRLNGPFRSA